MRILHVAQPTEAGVPAVVLALSADQLQRGWEVHLAHPSDGVLASHLPGAIHHVWEAKRSPGPGTARETVSLGRIIRSVQPDLLHLHSAKAGLAGRIYLRGKLPTVFQPHAWSFDAVEGPVANAAQLWERAAARWTDAIVCVGRVEREEGVSAGIKAPWEVVPNGVDLSRWTTPSERDRTDARARLGLPDGVTLAVCVGRLSRQKGQDVLLHAWKEVAAREPSARLMLVGEGETRRELEAIGAPGAELPGAVADPRDHLLAADLVVIASRWEGMSLSMLEAMACARSVVTTAVPGAEVVATAQAGAVVPVESPQALSEAILARLLDPALAASEGQRARSAVEERHDMNEVSERIAKLYAAVLERRQART